MRIFQNLNVDFIGKRKIFYIISGSIFLLGLINIIFRGLEFGTDFNGGSEIVLQFEKPVNIGTVRNQIQNIGLGNVELKTYGGDNQILINTELQNIPPDIYSKAIRNIDNQIENVLPGLKRSIVDSTSKSITYSFPNPDTTKIILDKLIEAGFQANKVSEEPTNTEVIVSIGIAQWIKENIREKMKDNPFQVLKEDQIGPKVGKELKQDAVIAIFLSLIVILLYLAFRFKFIFAFTAVLALFHDVLITLGLYSILYGLIPGLNLEIDLAIVAAFLTLIGYSINDTVVVFDRVRENMKIHKVMPLYQLMNMSLNKTMSRTVLTGGATLLSILVILIFGGEVLRAFAFTLFFGIVIGTYSSIFIASVLVYDYATKTNKKIEF
ncbi:MAG: protein-export membrane protein SecF [Ignavibacteria bacterium RIFOXYB2_FULL_35_12]|nr:MAG: protein-export membrane protein SecF [Ignavibacteria bacterium GWF2_35_20]OGU78005.1 MAG: protein-export membrane protein SecF [Ignavibacteria bacterium RIFOXYA2_FULL_35_9]OGU87108.1 MAG: protein-export membrane protein SecF [Ignavibacteria bacterium RIFOXYA12_FULL_35_25]OGU92423.1 MAG: protein-export membrane protein SecF [Ignavibacteria bacterium RIFOXYC12_FULL_35_11]OGU95800.1 MAG: protein-export membrane protein SecF [Ignavibacteria bacterium RIFOXYB12_FULL_35_14]OGU99613.1 MAG: pr